MMLRISNLRTYLPIFTNDLICQTRSMFITHVFLECKNLYKEFDAVKLFKCHVLEGWNHISSPLKSSINTSLTRVFLLTLPMAFLGMPSTMRSTWGIL